jgi:hypothetical protein
MISDPMEEFFVIILLGTCQALLCAIAESDFRAGSPF